MLEQKIRSVEEAVAMIRPDDQLAVPLGPGQPGDFLHGLNARDDFDGLSVFGALLVDLYEFLLKPGVRMVSGFFGPAERFLLDAGARIEFVPADFRRFEPILEMLHPRVMATVAAPPDAEGNMSLSLHAGATVSELHRVGADPDRLLIVEINPNFPRTVGLPPDHTHVLNVNEADVIIESERSPFLLEDAPATDVERAIAEHASHFIVDGSTVQTGIGGIPSTIASILAEGPGGDYGIHSEMFTTGLMRLHQAGKVTNRKGVYDGFSPATFAAGTRELYDWLDGNDEVRFLPVEYVNSPEIISRNRKMVCINGAVSIDLAGQIVADTVRMQQYSGIGGHEDFNASSGLSSDDRSLVCLPATATVNGELVSRIVDTFPGGTIVTTPRHQLDVVVTEYGAADLRGRTVKERARDLAGIAHPQFRDGLLEAAEQRPGF